MKYDPKEVTNLLAEDEGDYQVIGGVDEIGKSSGNEQMKLTIKGWDKKGKEGNIICYISQPWQLKKLCESAGRMDIFDRGDVIAKDVIGFAGKCVFKTDIDLTGKYDDKTVIGKFLKHIAGQPTKTQETKKDEFDDDIPF
jgi:hypothetical protein